jgi:peptidoglycan hydrolase FlgJ
MEPVGLTTDAVGAYGQQQLDQAARGLTQATRQQPIDRSGIPAGGRDINGRHYTAAELEGVSKAAQNFEAMVMGQMLQPMFQGLNTKNMFGGGFAEEMYRGLLVTEYGKMMAENGTLGIAEAVKRQLLGEQLSAAPETPNAAASSSDAAAAYANTDAMQAPPAQQQTNTGVQ